MRTVVISGGSSGIGKACVEKFLSQGDCVYNFDIEKNDELDKHTHYTWLMTDVRNQEAIASSTSQVIEKSGNIDVLITSAGKHLSANIETTSQEQLSDIMNLNMFGVFWLIQCAIAHMKQHKKGRIITIGSDQCSIVKGNSTAYGMTKAAILSLTKSIALNYAQYNIRANCIGAGTIDTPLYRNAINKYSKKSGIPLETIEKEEAEEQPVGRVGMPVEVAELAFFLAKENVDFMTGALLPIDGGYTIK